MLELLNVLRVLILPPVLLVGVIVPGQVFGDQRLGRFLWLFLDYYGDLKAEEKGGEGGRRERLFPLFQDFVKLSGESVAT